MWLSARDSFDESGIRGHIEDNELFLSMLAQTVKLTSNPVESMCFEINGTRYRTVCRNTKPGPGEPIIDVLFISEPEQNA